MVLSLVAIVLSPNSASAQQQTDLAQCLNASSEYNAVVFVKVIKANGNFSHWSTDFSFSVRSYAQAGVTQAEVNSFQDYRHNSIISWNNGKKQALGRDTITLNPKLGNDGQPLYGRGNLCDPNDDVNPGKDKRLGYAFRSGDGTVHSVPTGFFQNPNTPTPTARVQVGYPGRPNATSPNPPSWGNNWNNGSLSLSCLHSTATSYRFRALAVNDAGPGQFEQAVIEREPKTRGENLNNEQTRIKFVYRLSAEPEITPHATVNGSPNDVTVQTNQDVTFRNWAAVTNSPTNNGTFGVAIEDVFGNIPGGAWGPNTRNIINNDYPNDRRPLVIRFSETGQYCLRTRIFSVPSGVTTPAGLSVMRCVNVTDAPPPPAASCSGFTITMERTESRSFALNTSYAPPTPLPTNYVDPQVTWTVSGTGLNGATLTGIPASGTAPRTPIFTVSSGGIGTWQVTWGLTDGSVSGCIGTVSTEAKPYFKVFNGDVQAGTQFRTNGGSCTGTPTGRISAYNKGAGSSYAGSGSQIAAFALQPIQEFTSANRNPSLNPSVSLPRALTFANNGGSGYGGGSAMTACVPDYFGQRSPSLPATTGPRNLSTLITSSTITGLQQTIYVDGDLTIDTNITYAPWTAGSGEPPQRWFVVKGNIHVLSGVTQLAGVFVAQPKNDGTAGVFYTCSNGIGTPSHSMMVNECSTNRLTVNGAVMARRVELNRSQGTVAQAVSGESVAANNSAEVFIFNPLTWFSTPPGLSANDTSDYDALINLPPVL